MASQGALVEDVHLEEAVPRDEAGAEERHRLDFLPDGEGRGEQLQGSDQPE